MNGLETVHKLLPGLLGWQGIPARSPSPFKGENVARGPWEGDEELDRAYPIPTPTPALPLKLTLSHRGESGTDHGFLRFFDRHD